MKVTNSSATTIAIYYVSINDTEHNCSTHFICKLVLQY